MKWRIIVVGKPALDYARRGVAEYEKRLKRYAPCEIVFLRDADEARLSKAAEGCFRIVLDERGEALTTEAFRQQIDGWELEGTLKSIAILIGGADGHSDAMRQSADLCLGLSAFTLQHELALVVVLEQLYRVYTIKRGEPYHR